MDLDAFFIFGKGLILNLGSGEGGIKMKDNKGNLVKGIQVFDDVENAIILSKALYWMDYVSYQYTVPYGILRYYNTW